MIVPERRDSHASSSHEPSLKPTPTRSVDLGKHSFLITSLKTEIARSVRGPKLQGPRAEDALAEPYLVQKILGDLIAADHKVLSEGCESRHNHRYTEWCRTWPPNGSSRIRAKQKLLRKHKGACKSSWSRIGSLKSFILTIPWNLATPVKIFPGIIVRRHHTDRKQMRCWKSSAQSERRHLCSIVAIRSG